MTRLKKDVACWSLPVEAVIPPRGITISEVLGSRFRGNDVER